MKIRLGLLGAADSLEFVHSIINNRPEFICTPIECLHVEDLNQKVPYVLDEIDIWLCTGPITYKIVQDWNGIEAPVFYVDYKGSTLYKTVLQVLYKEKIDVNEISFDSSDKASWEKALQEAGIDTKPKFVESEMISLEGLIEYHYDLWKNGRTKAAITGHPICHELQSLGVPAYRSLPSSMAVEAVLTNILRTYEMLRFKATQIAVQIIEIDSLVGLVMDTYSTDEIFKIEMKYMEMLLSYTKKMYGSIKPAGFGRYVIFTTRGIVQELTHNFSHMPEIEQLQSSAVTCGIGIGQTVYDAEINAGNALLHAKSCAKGAWMVCFDDKKIAGPLGRPMQLTYSYTSERFKEISEKTELSAITLNKLKSSLKKLSSNKISAHELANYMQIPPRSARRILATLEEKGFAEVVANEKPHTKGRPRKVYHIFHF